MAAPAGAHRTSNEVDGEGGEFNRDSERGEPPEQSSRSAWKGALRHLEKDSWET